MYEFDDRLACAFIVMDMANCKHRHMTETMDFSLSNHMDIANCLAEAYIYLDELVNDLDLFVLYFDAWIAWMNMRKSVYKQLNNTCKNLQPR